MPILRITLNGSSQKEVPIDIIDPGLNEIFKDEEGLIFHSPGNTPTIEHPTDIRSTHLNAGSEIIAYWEWL